MAKITEQWPGQRRDIPKTVMKGYAEKWAKLPIPRLQLRWDYKALPMSAVAEENRYAKLIAKDMGVPPIINKARFCYYELILPLDKHDIRDEFYGVGFGIVALSTTKSTGEDRQVFSAPFRDGSHAFWDSEALGWLPIYLVQPDGSATQKSDYFNAPDEWKTP